MAVRFSSEIIHTLKRNVNAAETALNVSTDTTLRARAELCVQDMFCISEIALAPDHPNKFRLDDYVRRVLSFPG